MRNTTSQMADYSAILSCVEVQMQGTMPKGKFLMPRNVNLRARQRECPPFGKNHHKFSFSSSRFYIVHGPIPICIKGSRGLNENLLKCYCWGTLVDPENAPPLNLLSVMDQVLLMVSAIFSYMAGAVPERRRNFMYDSKKENLYSSSSMPYRRSEISENTPSLKTNAMWGEVIRKLLDALQATVNDASLDSQDAYFECDSKIYALSIFALNQGPTWRLLLATFWRLQKEVGDIQSSNEVANRGAWLVVVSEVYKGIITPICTKWLEEELSLDTGDCNMNLVVQLSDKLKGNDVILSSIKRSGKTDLYADLLFLLRFGSLRTGCCYDKNFLVKHGVEILEDLVITLADAVACIYLELISIDSDMSNEINALSLQICPLSTRSLQRLRNEVVLKQWLQQNFESVVSLYEDRFELLALFRQKLEDPLRNRTQSSIWQKLIFNKQAAPPSTLNCVQIKPLSLAVKRTKELQALTGWRYYFSLFLEFSDVAMPLVKAVFNEARNAVSFFLVCMIGRSLGLIFSGIRQSLGWK